MQRISGYSRRHVASLIFTEYSCLESYMPLLASISSQGVQLLGIRNPRFRLSTPHTLPKTSLYCEELLRSLSQYPSSCGRWHDSWVLPIAVQVPWATCRFTYFHREETTFCTLIGGSGRNVQNSHDNPRHNNLWLKFPNSMLFFKRNYHVCFDFWTIKLFYFQMLQVNTIVRTRTNLKYKNKQMSS